MKYGFGVDIGGTTIKIGLFSVEGDLIEKWKNRFRNSWSWWRNWSYACKG